MIATSTETTETLPFVSATANNAPQPVKPRVKKKMEFVKDEDALSSYLNEIKKVKSLTLAEEGKLAVRIQQGDKSAMNELVQANLKFVVAVCRNYQYQGLPMGDLINEGNLGLIRAAYEELIDVTGAIRGMDAPDSRKEVAA